MYSCLVTGSTDLENPVGQCFSGGPRMRNGVVCCAIAREYRRAPILWGSLPLAQKCIHVPQRASEVNISLDLSLAAQTDVGDPTLKRSSIHPHSLPKGAAKPGTNLRILRYIHATGSGSYASSVNCKVPRGVLEHELPIKAVPAWENVCAHYDLPKSDDRPWI